MLKKETVVKALQAAAGPYKTRSFQLRVDDPAWSARWQTSSWWQSPGQGDDRRRRGEEQGQGQGQRQFQGQRQGQGQAAG